MTNRSSLSLLLALFSGLVGGTACTRDEKPDESTFYSRRIGPLLEESCSSSSTGPGRCHVVQDDRGNALGNLSVESYETLALRRDLLVNYGPYGIPGLLLKVVPDFKLSLTSYDSSTTLITTNVMHVGEKLIDFTTPGYSTLEAWIRNGATKNNARGSRVQPTTAQCTNDLGNDPRFDPSVRPTTDDYPLFAERVGAMLGQRCAAGNCHGSPANSLYLTCGESEEELRWNYFATADYVSSNTLASEIIQRVLDPDAGGTFHEGGVIFTSADDENYTKLVDWAKARGGPLSVPNDPGFAFFASRVQPMLVKRGCMMLGCHSSSMFHDYRLRGGSGGHFSLPATRKNYELSLEQLALESPDPNTSRLIQKNLPVANGGITHRGGPLFAGYDVSQCDRAAAEMGPLDEQAPYCVISAWIAKEREARMASAVPLSAIVYVRRSVKPGLDAPQDYASFAGGGSVIRRAATLASDGSITLGEETNLSELCGLSSDAEVRRPAVSWDGLRIAFSARAAASAPFRIYVVDGERCEVETAIDRAPVADSQNEWNSNGELVHNFDPTFAPDGRIVFVSTRGNVTNSGVFSYSGPQRTPADPSKLNANLYVREADGRIRQLTFLLNQELLPAFMRDGRVIFSTEKRAPGFYQLAGRRINLDGGDYHPLFAQRSSIGFTQFTDVVELANKNFAAIASNRGAHGGRGTLVVVNRSLGIDQRSEKAADFPLDPSAIDFPAPGFYQHSLSVVNRAATGSLAGTRGAYATPSPLPDGRILVSYSAEVTDLASASGNFDIAVVDPRRSGDTSTTPLITGDGDDLWPVGVYARQNLGIFKSRFDEPNGSTRVLNGHEDAEILFMDAPLLATLLFQNTRSGRPILDGAANLEIWESLPPEPGVTTTSGSPFITEDEYGPLYVRRARLGELRTFKDGSANVSLPGGVPFLLATPTQLSGDSEPALHFQREEMQAYPGEHARQSFRREFFNNLCGGCHGSVAGLEHHVAADPDILTRASEVEARETLPIRLEKSDGHGQGPEFP